MLENFPSTILAPMITQMQALLSHNLSPRDLEVGTASICGECVMETDNVFKKQNLARSEKEASSDLKQVAGGR